MRALRRPPTPPPDGDATGAGSTAVPAADRAAGSGSDGTGSPGAAERLGVLAGSVVDRALAVAVVAFATWTALYELALAQLLPAVLAGWLALAAAAVLAVPVWRAARLVPAGPGRTTWLALLVAGGLGALTAVLSRPDLDDAAFVTRSTWVAGTGRITDRDTMFSDGVWPGLNGQSPYVPSVEALVGLVSRASGVSVGSLVYVVLPPLAAAATGWALWLLVRAWDARRPGASLALAVVFLLLGGGTAASFGTYELTRIWQGKAFFLALVVPLLYACAAAWWRATSTRARRLALAGAAVLGVVGVGLTTSATFVVPAVAVVAAVPGLLARTWGRVLALVVAASAAPVAAALASVLVRRSVALTAEPLGPTENPWLKVLGSGAPALVAVVAGVAVLAGWALPRWWGVVGGRVGATTAAAAVVVGAALCVPWVPHVVSTLLGTTAISWRLAWVVPVPVLVGLVASLPARRAGLPVTVLAPALALALVVGGVPLWDARSGTALQSPRAWKVYPEDLRAAEWVVRAEPSGRVLAPARVVSAAQTLSHTVDPVGGRLDHMATLDTIPEARAPERRALQRLVEGAPEPGDLARAPRALAALDVEIACAAWPGEELRAVLAAAGLVEEYLDGPYLCARRAPGGGGG